MILMIVRLALATAALVFVAIFVGQAASDGNPAALVVVAVAFGVPAGVITGLLVHGRRAQVVHYYDQRSVVLHGQGHSDGPRVVEPAWQVIERMEQRQMTSVAAPGGDGGITTGRLYQQATARRGLDALR